MLNLSSSSIYHIW